MPSLKSYRIRIKSVKSTQKITKAMKMVAAAKLRRAKDAAEAARPYAEKMEQVLLSLAESMKDSENAPALLKGTGQAQPVHLLVVATSDRGLCGAFNSSIVRAARRKIREWQAKGDEVRLFCVGRKGYEQIKGEYEKIIIERVSEIGKRRLAYRDAEKIAQKILELFEAGKFDSCTVIYNHFKSAIAQKVTLQQLVPLAIESRESRVASREDDPLRDSSHATRATSPYEYEPSEEEILADLLPRNIGVQIYKALLENAASEQGARMTAMDSATRNAGEMIKKLTLQYNRSRQATITKELIEIISGAEAV